MADIKRRIAEGKFAFAEEFPDYRLITQVVGAPPAQRTLLPFALASPRDSACQIVLRPLASPDSASSPEGVKVSLEKAQKKWRRGWDCSRPGTAARPSLRSGPPRLGRDVQKSLRNFCRTHGQNP
jgi:hypothetical protein